jgi:hypothetical protein
VQSLAFGKDFPFALQRWELLNNGQRNDQSALYQESCPAQTTGDKDQNRDASETTAARTQIRHDLEALSWGGGTEGVRHGQAVRF